MTMLLGGAKLLKKREAELKGTVKLIFQPAEEGGAGGERMVKEGTHCPSFLCSQDHQCICMCLSRFAFCTVFKLHTGLHLLWPGLA